MDVPAAAAGPWIALGVVLGILLLLAVGAVVLRLRAEAGRPTTPPAAPPEARDDLADFLEHPPGTPGAPDDDGEGWTSLSTPPPPDRDAPGPAPTAPGTVLAGFAIAALLLVGTAAAFAAARSPERPAAPDTAESQPSDAGASMPDLGDETAPGGLAASTVPLGPDGVAARLAFDGVVLEEHAVGVTAAYPELELTWNGDRAVAHLRLPTANCLAAEAPASAGNAACQAGRTEYADLATPDLRVVRDGETVRITGSFATYLRPAGRPAEWTGRSYEVTVAAVPTGDDGSGWLPAGAQLRWDDEQVTARAQGEPSVLRYGG